LVLGWGLFGFVDSVRAGFGVSPAGLYHQHLKPGTCFSQDFVISRADPDEELVAVIEADLPEIGDWFQFEPGKKFTLPAGQKRVDFTIKVCPPNETPSDRYQGVIRVKATPREEEIVGVSVVKGARIEVDLTTSEENFTDLIVRQIKIGDVKGKEPIRVWLKIENRGNTVAAPDRLELEILDLRQQPLTTLQTERLAPIPPSETKEIEAQLETDLGSGEYFAWARVYLGDQLLRQERLVFQISGREKQALPEKETPKKTALFNRFKEKGRRSGFLILAAIFGFGLVLLALHFRRQKKAIPWVFPLLGGLTLLALAISWNQPWLKSSIPEAKPTPTPAAQVKGLTVEQEASASGENKFQPLKVVGQQEQIYYRIYRRPNLKAQVVYFATEGEQFQVLEERAHWYRVLLDDGTDGWLPKANVKEVNP